MNILNIAKELAAISQTGAHFSKDEYDLHRYRRVSELASILLSGCSDVSPQELYAWSREKFGYATPKVDVRAFISDGERVLLIREDADQGRWTLPGGWADVNESPSEAVLREVEEESATPFGP
jgi:hypothetical protein